MTLSPAPQPRLLLVGTDATWRACLPRAANASPAVSRMPGCAETVAWLEGRDPGVTLVAETALEGGFEALLRIRELHPRELVVLVADDPDAETYRGAMRAGAFDVLATAACSGPALDETLAHAARRLEASCGARATRQAGVRDAVRRHERAAAAVLVQRHAASAAWSAVPVDVRRRWLHAYIKAATSGDDDGRAGFVKDLAADAALLERPGELLIALHVHAMASGHGQAELGMEPARTLLIEVLAETADQRRSDRPADGAPPAPRGACWHRWRLHGSEQWWLVVDGRLRAHVEVGPSTVEGTWTSSRPERGRTTVDLVSGPLPDVPEALREVERRVGCGYVLDVVSAEPTLDGDPERHARRAS